jgi:hypothetical protein
VNLDDVRWAAQRTVAMHAEPPTRDRATGRCAQCRADGTCAQLAWALTLADQLAEQRGAHA